ncbi:MAG: hypothetical protein IPK91_15210 [Saprospiraceae bacterium]|nr:hypothetical protein [Saprospiraceae bacterium]
MITSPPLPYDPSGEHPEYKSKKQFSQELGLNIKTFSRKLKEKGFKLKRGFLSPMEQREIKIKLGYLDCTNHGFQLIGCLFLLVG